MENAAPHGAVISGLVGVWRVVKWVTGTQTPSVSSEAGPWQTSHLTGGWQPRLLKASEGKFGDVALTLSSVHFLSARNLFHNSFVERISVKWTEQRRSALGSRTACSATGCTHHVLSYKSIFCRVSCHFTDVRSFQRKCLWIDTNHKLNDSDERGLPD